MSFTDQLTPGYLVEHQSFENGIVEQTFFTNDDLLTARKEAFLFGLKTYEKKEPSDVLDMTIHLVEKSGDELITPFIAQVFGHRFHRKRITTDGDLIDLFRSDDEEEETITLTIDPTRVDETFETQQAVIYTINELTPEYEYYRSYGHPPGLGFFQAVLNGPFKYPFTTSWLLADAMTFVSALIDKYNRNYASADEQIIITVSPVDPY